MQDDSAARRAQDLFEEGYLCSQAVLLAFADRLDMDRSVAARLGAPFGAGIGRLGRTCGAVSGALMALGLGCGHETPQDADGKERALAAARTLLARFEDVHGTVECRALLGYDLSDPAQLDRAREEAIFDRLCPAFVRTAADSVARILEEVDS